MSHGLKNYITTLSALSSMPILNRDNLQLYYSAKVFEIDNAISSLLEMTDNKITPVKLPYPIIFIDTKLQINILDYCDAEVYGFLCMEIGNYEINDFVFKTAKSIGDVKILTLYNVHNPKNENLKKLYNDANERGDGLVGFGEFNLIDSDMSIDERKKKLNDKDIPESKRYPQLYYLENRIGAYLVNFLNLLEYPEVKLEEVIRSDKNIKKRMDRNLIPLPSTTIVKVTGMLKKYVDYLKKKTRGQIKYSYKFWVRGHWRHLESEFYTHKKGTKIWILPHIKGEGELMNKTYFVEGEKLEVINESR